jgi:site-specific recombinase XerD
MTCKNKKCTATLNDGAVFCHICGKRQEHEPKKWRKRPNGSGTVYKLSGRRRRPWVAAKNGVIIDYYETRTAAQEALDRMGSNPISEKVNMTFSEVYEAWKLEHFRDLTDSGKSGYGIAYNQFEPLHNEAFRKLRTTDYQKCVDVYVAKGRKHSTASKLKQLIGQLSKWSMREEIVTTNFAQFIRLPEKITVEKEIFSDGDIEKLKESKDDAAKIILMLIYTGMRIGELFNMTVGNVRKTYCIGGSKSDAGRNRVIPIVDTVRPHFAYFSSIATSESFLSGYEGNHDIKNFRERDYYPLLDYLGIKAISPHSTRHTFASMAVKSGMNRESLQKILGHAKYSTSADIYVHSDIDVLISAAQRLSEKSRPV